MACLRTSSWARQGRDTGLLGEGRGPARLCPGAPSGTLGRPREKLSSEACACERELQPGRREADLETSLIVIIVVIIVIAVLVMRGLER